MSTSMSAGVGDLPCFILLISLNPNQTEKYLIFPCTCLFIFCNIIMTGEPGCTILEERMASGLLFFI